MRTRTPLVQVEVVGRTPPAADAVAFLAIEGEAPPLREGAGELATLVAGLAQRSGWTGRRGQSVATVTGSGIVVLLRGLGLPGELSWPRLQIELAGVCEAAVAAGCGSLELVLPATAPLRGFEAVERLATFLSLWGYRFTAFRTPPEREAQRLGRVVLAVPREEDHDTWCFAAEWGTRVARAIALARDLANHPPNVAHPEWMAEQIRVEAKHLHARVRVWAERDLEKRGCGGLLAVGSGAAHGPRMVVLEWSPPEPEGCPHLALVGKGVTFDTGGYSIKPNQGLAEMKYDKAGACTVLAAALAAIEAELPLRLSVFLPFAENAIDANAYRPGDIIRHPNGRSTEIVDTDAEGRLLLADALCLAAATKPDALVELSTLTGACVVALGHRAAGLWTEDRELARSLVRAGERVGERLWRLPLFAEDREAMEGTHGDFKNLGSREGGANTAAAFLSQFVTGAPSWAHVDIAGVAFGGEPSKASHGATGWGVATLLQWLRATAAGSSHAVS